MATTLSPPTEISNGLYRFTWTGTAPFRVFSYQTFEYLYESTDLTEITMASSGGRVPAIEVFDSTETTVIPEGLLYPAKAILQWRGYQLATLYRIDKYVSAAWVQQDTIIEDGRGYYRYTSPVADDSISQEIFRIVTIDATGSETASSITPLIIRNPSSPIFSSITYNSGTLTLTATLTNA